MARMRFPSRPRPRSLHDVISTDDRPVEHLGDVPSVPAEPVDVKWSLTTYPYADPARDEEDGDG